MDPATAARIITIARGQIGTKEDPPNSNRNPYGAALGRDGEPWCAMFVSWCFRQAGSPLPDVNGPAGLFTFCPSGVSWAQAHGQVVATPEPGDVLLFDWNGDGTADHVGIFVSADAAGSWSTIEGNTSSGSDSDGGQVQQRTRWANQVTCVWRPAVGAAGAVGPSAPAGGVPAPGDKARPRPTAPAVHPGIANLGGAVLSAGRRASGVIALQHFLSVAASLLKDLTLSPGGAGGAYDAPTVAAVASWQRRVGATPDGAWGPQTYASSSAHLDRVVPAIVLEEGAAGPQVVQVQRFLVRVAEVCSDPTLDPHGVDSQFGAATAGAVRALQGRVGATPDSDWGPDTVARTATFLEGRP